MDPESELLRPSSGGNQKRKKKGNRRGRSLPQRTCIGCRTVNPKREMMRVVRTPDQKVEIDPSGKQSGRGAYICQQKSCWQIVLQKHSLERALGTKLDEQAEAALIAFVQTLPEETTAVSDNENH